MGRGRVVALTIAALAVQVVACTKDESVGGSFGVGGAPQGFGGTGTAGFAATGIGGGGKAGVGGGSAGVGVAVCPTVPTDPCGGTMETLVTSSEPWSALASDEQGVYVAGAGSIEYVDKQTASLSSRASTNGPVLRLAVAQLSLLWTENSFGSDGSKNGVVERIFSNGGGLEFVFASDTEFLYGPAVSPLHVLWMSDGTTALPAKIHWMLTGGGSDEAIVDVPFGYNLRDVGSDDSSVCWLVRSDYCGAVRRRSVDSVVIDTLVAGTWQPLSIAVDAGGIYFTAKQSATSEASLVTLRTDGSNLDVLASGLVDPAPIAVDSEFVYYIANFTTADGTSTRGVARVGRFGGAPATLLAIDPDATTLSIDCGCVYWLSGPQGGPTALKRISKQAVVTGATPPAASFTTSDAQCDVFDLDRNCPPGVQLCGLPSDAPCPAGHFCASGCCRPMQ